MKIAGYKTCLRSSDIIVAEAQDNRRPRFIFYTRKEQQQIAACNNPKNIALQLAYSRGHVKGLVNWHSEFVDNYAPLELGK